MAQTSLFQSLRLSTFAYDRALNYRHARAIALPFLQEIAKFLCRDRIRYQIALHEVAPGIGQYLALPAGLDSFSDRLMSSL